MGVDVRVLICISACCNSCLRARALARARVRLCALAQVAEASFAQLFIASAFAMGYFLLPSLHFLAYVAAGSQEYVAFDDASASSTYSAGNLQGSPAFAAQQALSGGSGYW